MWRVLLLVVFCTGCSSGVLVRRITVRAKPAEVRAEFSRYAGRLGTTAERMPVYRKATQAGLFGPVRTDEEIPPDKAPLVLGFRYQECGFVLREGLGAMTAEVERKGSWIDPTDAVEDLDYVARDLAAYFASRFGDAVEGPTKPARHDRG